MMMSDDEAKVLITRKLKNATPQKDVFQYAFQI
jgi:hypothetical protein